MKEWFSVASGALFLLGFVPYIRAILRRETVPVRSTWVIWTALDVIALTSMYAQHALNFHIVGAATGAFIVMVLSFRYGGKGWSGLDLFCLAGAVLGIGLWLFLGDPLLALIASQSTAQLGSFPTIASVWRDPSMEDRTAWALFGASVACVLVAVPAFEARHLIQPINFAITITVVNAIIWLKKPSHAPTKEDRA